MRQRYNSASEKYNAPAFSQSRNRMQPARLAAPLLFSEIYPKTIDLSREKWYIIRCVIMPVSGLVQSPADDPIKEELRFDDA